MHQTPAQAVITAAAGIRPLARRLKVHPSSVWRWNAPKPRGSAGIIPAEYHRAILALGLPGITADVLVFGAAEAAA